MAWLGADPQGPATQAGRATARLGESWLGRHGGARPVSAASGSAGMAWQGEDWRGAAGRVWSGMAWRGVAGRGGARQVGSGVVCIGGSRQRMASSGRRRIGWRASTSSSHLA